MLSVYGLTQHAGLGENVLDHRLNTRTVYMNPVIRFLYWNMNYHVEHHMFPMVPYHRLAELHEEIKHDCAAAVPVAVGGVQGDHPGRAAPAARPGATTCAASCRRRRGPFTSRAQRRPAQAAGDGRDRLRANA